MAFGQKIIPVIINLDKSADYITQSEARFIKNLTSYVGTNDSVTGITQGENALNLHSLQSNELYTNVALPSGENFCIHAQGFAQVNRVYVWVWNSLGNHCIYRLNGKTRTSEMVYQSPCLNFQLKPEYFIHEAGTWLEVVYLADPITGNTVEKEDLYWTDGFNYQGYIRTNDSIATNSFNATIYPYFIGDYDPCTLVRMGLPTPMDCIQVLEVPNVSDETNNNIKFRGLQFRVLGIDVWGRPSEHGIISDLYIWGGNNCSGGDNGARCLDLNIKVTNPIIDKLQIETSEDNSITWHRVDIIDLYQGGNFSNWWLRVRNPNIPFDQVTSTYTYTFCNDRENIVIPPAETNRTENPLSRTSQTLFKLNKNIAVGNNKYGFAPFSQDLLSNFRVKLVEKKVANVPPRNIRIALSIRNLAFQPQFVHRYGTGSGDAVYGGSFKNPFYPNFPLFNPQAFYYAPLNLLQQVQQAFGNPNQTGFVGILAGTGEPPITVVSEQYYLDATTNTLVKLATYDNFDANREYFQVFTFSNVRAGKYVFQLCNPTSKLSDPQYWKTSANLVGTYNISGIPSTNPYVVGTQKNTNKQLIIDVCNGDYDFVNAAEVLVVMDLTHPCEYASNVVSEVDGTNAVKRLTGYIYETTPQINPIELLAISTEFITIHKIDYSFVYTDQNGYYMVAIFYKGVFDRGSTKFNGFCKGTFKTLFTINSEGRFNTGYIGASNNLEHEGTCQGFYFNSCNRVKVTGKIIDCDTGLGLSGVGVVLDKGQYALSDQDGNYTIIAHYDGTHPTLNRVSPLYFIQNRCGYADCTGAVLCSNAIETFPIPNPLLPCVEVFATNSIPVLSIFIVNSSQSSHLLSGGQYGACVIGFDWLRRHNFAQTSDKLYFNVPTLAQSGGKYYTAELIINPAANFPSWMQLLTTGTTLELTIEDYIEWIVDSFVFIDNSGNENIAAPTQIKIFYRSLPEYNKQNNFNTTTGWTFISETTGDPRTSDYVDFIVNGDGTYFGQAVRQIVKYNKDGAYFLVDYDSNLSSLKPNARIRLVRPKTDNNDRKIFYENCTPVKVINGKAQQNEINLPFFDTYNVYRQIPIPTASGDTFINEIITFGTPFEHHSPNDLWGYKIKNIGRVFAVNPYEGEILRINEVALSGAMSINGVLNYLSYFDDIKKTDFDVNNTGGISAGFADVPGLVRFVTQFSSFKVGYNDNLGRVNADGTFQAPSTPNSFGTPQAVSSDNVGCQLKDKNAIGIRNGLITFPDRNRGELFQYDYDKVTSYTKDKCDAWFRAKCRVVSADPNRYFTKAINPITNEYMISDFSLIEKIYDNQLRTYEASAYETVSFDMGDKSLRMWTSFIGENYAFLDGDILNNNLFSFKGAQPYNHYNLLQNKSYNSFFGIQGGKVYQIVGNSPAFKKKKFLTISVYCKQSKLFADNITTETGQLSYILLDGFEWAEFFSFAPMLCDLNTLSDPNLSIVQNTNKILEGNNLYGLHATVRLIGDPANDGNYVEIFGVVIDSFVSEKTG